jgi:hypothetical protein
MRIPRLWVPTIMSNTMRIFYRRCIETMEKLHGFFNIVIFWHVRKMSKNVNVLHASIAVIFKGLIAEQGPCHIDSFLIIYYLFFEGDQN